MTEEEVDHTESIGSMMQIFLARLESQDFPDAVRKRHEDYEKHKSEVRTREEKEAEERRMKIMRIPEKFKRISLDNYPVQSERHRHVIQFLKKHRAKNLTEMENLIVRGYRGTGKTRMLCAYLQSQQSWTGQYWKFSDIMRTVKDIYSRHSKISELRFIKRLSETPVLVIDEIGRQGGTVFEGNFAFDLIDDRVANMLPTILVSNLPLNGTPSITSYLGGAAMDRFNEYSVDIVCDWGNYRNNSEERLK